MVDGLLWFDHDGELAERILRGIQYYAKKYGEMPSIVLINNSELQYQTEVQGVLLKPCISMLPCHYLIGHEREVSNAA